MTWKSAELHGLWNWLPAFRVVAETEHLPSASEALRVSPSALSRTIRLLEEAVGRKLFERKGRTMRLNAAGSSFLLFVRDAMRLTDEGLAELRQKRHMGRVVIAVTGPMVSVVLGPALALLRRRHPALVPSLVTTGNVNVRILRGEVDLGLVIRPTLSHDLVNEPLLTLQHGVFCARSHPLGRRRSLTIAELCEHEFVAPPGRDDGQAQDEWPAHIRRKVALEVTHMQFAIDICSAGDLLAVLPDLVGQRADLVRLPVDVATETTLYLVHRPTLPAQTRGDVAAQALRDSLAA